MMKLAFALFALFYLCYGAPATQGCHNLDPNLNHEIITKMANISKTVTFSSGTRILLPTNKILKKACKCVARIATELDKVLSNVTVPKKGEKILEGLKANVKMLKEANPVWTNVTCDMEEKQNPDDLHRYIIFMRKLNSSSKK